MVIDIETMVPEDSFGRVLKRAMGYDWLTEQLKPYFPDANDETASPLRTLALIMIEHLQPYAPRYADKPFLWSIYGEWATSFDYMLLLAAVPPEIPPFEDIVNPVYERLPSEVLYELLRHILISCIGQRVAAEYRDEKLYYIQSLSSEEQTAEAERLARLYTEQFYKEVRIYRDSASAQP